MHEIYPLASGEDTLLHVIYAGKCQYSSSKWNFKKKLACLCMLLREAKLKATYSAKDIKPSCLSALERKWQQCDKIVTLSQKIFFHYNEFSHNNKKAFAHLWKKQVHEESTWGRTKTLLAYYRKDGRRCAECVFFPNNNFWERAFAQKKNLSHVCPSSSPSLHGEEAAWLRSYLVGDTNVFQSTFCHHDCLITGSSVLNLLSTQHALFFYFLFYYCYHYSCLADFHSPPPWFKRSLFARA